MPIRRPVKFAAPKNSSFFVEQILNPMLFHELNPQVCIPAPFTKLMESGEFENCSEDENFKKSDKVICQHSFIMRDIGGCFYLSDRQDKCEKMNKDRISEGMSCVFSLSGNQDGIALIPQWFDNIIRSTKEELAFTVYPKGVALNMMGTKIMGHMYQPRPWYLSYVSEVVIDRKENFFNQTNGDIIVDSLETDIQKLTEKVKRDNYLDHVIIHGIARNTSVRIGSAIYVPHNSIYGMNRGVHPFHSLPANNLPTEIVENIKEKSKESTTFREKFLWFAEKFCDAIIQAAIQQMIR